MNSDSVFIIAVVALIFLCAGDPDVLDAIQKRIASPNCEVAKP
ncbi:MAG: hypothetical protein ACOY9J_08625 [Pseudomonadota bacterium]